MTNKVREIETKNKLGTMLLNFPIVIAILSIVLILKHLTMWKRIGRLAHMLPSISYHDNKQGLLPFHLFFLLGKSVFCQFFRQIV